MYILRDIITWCQWLAIQQLQSLHDRYRSHVRTYSVRSPGSTAVLRLDGLGQRGAQQA